MFTENAFAGLNKHELSKKKIFHDVEVQTEDIHMGGERGSEQPLFESLLQGLEEIVHTGLTAQTWDNRSDLLFDVHEPESSDHSSSESAVEEMGECEKRKEEMKMSIPIKKKKNAMLHCLIYNFT